VACIVGTMCELVAEEVRNGNEAVIKDANRITGGTDHNIDISDPKQLAQSILHCCYMGTAHSSYATRSRALNLAAQIGAYFSNMEVHPLLLLLLLLLIFCLVEKKGYIGQDFILNLSFIHFEK
jgi:NAD+ synthase (glutamine-hydrolysing)